MSRGTKRIVQAPEVTGNRSVVADLRLDRTLDGQENALATHIPTTPLPASVRRWLDHHPRDLGNVGTPGQLRIRNRSAHGQLRWVNG